MLQKNYQLLSEEDELTEEEKEEEERRKLRAKTLRVAFIPTMVSGVAYYRLCNFAWQMRKYPNVETVVFPYSSNHVIENPWQKDIITMPEVWRKFDNIIAASDVVVWQMLHYENSYELWEEMKYRHQKPFLMELDDYISDVPVSNEAFNAYGPASSHHRVAMKQIKASDGLIVSTPYLAKLYEGEHANIHVAPNSIDLEAWAGLADQHHTRTRIGWIGGGTHSADLEMVAPALEQVLDEYQDKDVWFYCVHGVPEIFKKWQRQGKNVYWTHKWGKINLYPRFMASFKFDIGIAPLEDNNFNRGKSNLRWLEYSALKIPTVASPLPDFTRSIVGGHNGFIARDEQDWIDCLKTLIESPSMRKEIGQNAYASVKASFNARKNAQNYLRILRGYL